MPSAVLVRSVGPKLFLSTITFCWGLVMMVTFPPFSTLSVVGL